MAIWSEWGRLTRFLESSRIALRREQSIFGAFSDGGTTKLRSTEGQSSYEVDLLTHCKAIGDEELLFALVLVHSYALVESAAADVLGAHVAKLGGIESWGAKLLKSNRRAWSAVKDEKYGLVEVAVVRNAVAHGSWALDQRGFNRLSAAKKGHPWNVGNRVALDSPMLDEYRARLKSLLRASAVR